jgi:dUTPase
MKGQRLLQIVAADLEPITFEICEKLSETIRSDNGVGSTGE